MNLPLFLLTGYKRTGKDTFAQFLKTRTRSINDLFRYFVYVRVDKTKPTRIADTSKIKAWLQTGQFNNFSFAEQLKKQVLSTICVSSHVESNADTLKLLEKHKDLKLKDISQLLSTENKISKDTSSKKDEQFFAQNNTTIQKSEYTFRDLLKETATQTRKQDDAFYASHLLKQIKQFVNHTSEDNLKSDKCLIVTDWRYEIEYKTMIQKYDRGPVVTSRIICEDVPIPSKEDVSEHSMDSTHTDILIVRALEGLSDIDMKPNCAMSDASQSFDFLCKL